MLDVKMAIINDAPMYLEMRQEINTSEQEVWDGMHERFLSKKLKNYYKKEKLLELMPTSIDKLLTIESVEIASTNNDQEYNEFQEIPMPKPYEMRDTILEFMDYVITICVCDMQQESTSSSVREINKDSKDATRLVVYEKRKELLNLPSNIVVSENIPKIFLSSFVGCRFGLFPFIGQQKCSRKKTINYNSIYSSKHSAESNIRKIVEDKKEETRLTVYDNQKNTIVDNNYYNKRNFLTVKKNACVRNNKNTEGGAGDLVHISIPRSFLATYVGNAFNLFLPSWQDGFFPLSILNLRLINETIKQLDNTQLFENSKLIANGGTVKQKRLKKLPVSKNSKAFRRLQKRNNLEKNSKLFTAENTPQQKMQVLANERPLASKPKECNARTSGLPCESHIIYSSEEKDVEERPKPMNTVQLKKAVQTSNNHLYGGEKATNTCHKFTQFNKGRCVYSIISVSPKKEREEMLRISSTYKIVKKEITEMRIFQKSADNTDSYQQNTNEFISKKERKKLFTPVLTRSRDPMSEFCGKYTFEATASMAARRDYTELSQQQEMKRLMAISSYIKTEIQCMAPFSV